MRSALLDLTPVIPVTACHQRNYVETYSRFMPDQSCAAWCVVRLHLARLPATIMPCIAPDKVFWYDGILWKARQPRTDAGIRMTDARSWGVSRPSPDQREGSQWPS